MTVQQAILVFAGGGCGSVLRFGITRLLQSEFPKLFPLGTLACNILACLLLVLALRVKVTDSFIAYFVVVGICGGFSTFSTFAYETAVLFKNGNYAIAGSNILLSVISCVAICYYLTQLQPRY